jgi:hypothetical protein
LFIFLENYDARTFWRLRGRFESESRDFGRLGEEMSSSSLEAIPLEILDLRPLLVTTPISIFGLRTMMFVSSAPPFVPSLNARKRK